MSYYNRFYKIITLISVLTAGLYVGYDRQIIADSGDLNLQKVYISVFIGGVSYLIGFLFLFWKDSFFKVPNWIFIIFLGSLICAIAMRFHDRLFFRECGDNYFGCFSPDAVGLSIILAIMTFFIAGFFHLINWLISFLLRRKNVQN